MHDMMYITSPSVFASTGFQGSTASAAVYVWGLVAPFDKDSLVRISYCLRKRDTAARADSIGAHVYCHSRNAARSVAWKSTNR